jgi:gluconokinase
MFLMAARASACLELMNPLPKPTPPIVVMGVSGCGKSTVGRALAQALGRAYVEGDDLHPPRNVALMAAGTALTDSDRQGWLASIGHRLSDEVARSQGVVVACSALKRSYRDQLRGAAPATWFVHLHGPQPLLAQRLAQRTDHYMPPSLLQSQIDTLEPPGPGEAALQFDINPGPEHIVADVLAAMAQSTACAASVHHPTPAMQFTQVILYTDTDGRARFRQALLPLDQGKPQARLSALMPSAGLQLRTSPVGFRSEFHCTETPQWVFILSGQMEIGLQDGSSRVFKPGQHFFSTDVLPAGQTFDAQVHGHWSRQLGDEPLSTLFVRA